jgi:hypothetical protein
VTNEEEIRELKERMALMEQNMVRLCTLVAIINGVNPDAIDQAIIEEQTKLMRERGEL